jgi:hypothetical protein
MVSGGFDILDLGWVAARVNSDDHRISWPEDLCKSSQKFGSLVTSEVAYILDVRTAGVTLGA